MMLSIQFEWKWYFFATMVNLEEQNVRTYIFDASSLKNVERTLLLFSVFNWLTFHNENKSFKMVENLQLNQYFSKTPLYLKTKWILLRVPSFNSERYVVFKFEWLRRKFFGLNYSNMYCRGVSSPMYASSLSAIYYSFELKAFKVFESKNRHHFYKDFIAWSKKIPLL